MGERRFSRRLAAVVAADIVGYSKLMGADEEGTLERLKSLRTELIEPAVLEHGGRIVKTTGDGFLIEFASTIDAFRFSVALLQGSEEQSGSGDDLPFQFRVGINVGDIIFDEGDVYGDGVNIAARLESIAAPGAICLSERAWSDLKRLPLTFEDLGVKSLKNIEQGIQAYQHRVVKDARPQALAIAPRPAVRISRSAVVFAAVLAVVGVGAFATVRYAGLLNGSGPQLEVGAFRASSPGIADNQMVGVAEELRNLLNLDSQIEERLQGISGNPVRLTLTGAARRAGDKVNFSLELRDQDIEAVAASIPAVVPVAEMPVAPQQLGVKAKSFLACVLHPLGHSDYRSVPARQALYRYCAGLFNASSSFGNDLRSAQLLTEKAPNSSFAWSTRALAAVSAYYNMENKAQAAEAESASRKALSLDRRNAEALLAKVYLKLHQSKQQSTAEIERMLQDAVRGRPSSCGCEAWQLGELLLASGRVSEAIKLYRVSYDQNPLDPEYANSLAYAMFVKGDSADAYSLLTEVMRTWPSNHALLHTALLASVKAGDFDYARRMIKRHQEMESHTFGKKQQETLLVALDALERRRPEVVSRANTMLTDLARDQETRTTFVALLLSEVGNGPEAAKAIRLLAQEEGSKDVLFWESFAALRSNPDVLAALKDDKLISIWRETRSKPDFCRKDTSHPTCALLSSPAS